MARSDRISSTPPRRARPGRGDQPPYLFVPAAARASLRGL